MAYLGDLTADLNINTESLGRAEREMRRFGRSAKSTTDQFNNDLLKLGRTLASFAAVFYTLKNALRVFAIGIEFQRTIEDTGLSLSGLVASLYDYRDATGKTLQGVDAFIAAQQDVIGIQQEMRVAGLKTAATYQELMEALQQAFAPAKEAGVALGQMVPFVQRLTQIAQVAGVPMHQLNEEIRSFTTGAMTRRTTRIMPFMESIGLTNKEIRKLIASGKLYEELMQRSVQISILAGKSVNTWTVSLSNLQDAFQNIMGVGLEGTFGMLKILFLEMTDAIVQINEETSRIEFNPTFLAAIKSIDRNMHSALISTKNFAKEIARLQQEHPVITQLLTDFGGIAIKLAAIGLGLKLLTGSFRLAGRAILSSLKLIPAMLGTVFRQIVLLVPSVISLVRAFALLIIPSTVVAGVIGVTAGIIATIASVVLLRKEISSTVKYLWDFVKDWEVLGYTVEEAGKIALLNIEKIGTYMGLDLRQIINDLGYAFDTFWDDLKEGWKEAWGEMPESVRTACEIIEGVVKGLINDLIKYINEHPLTIKMIVEAQKEAEAAGFGPGTGLPEADDIIQAYESYNKLNERRKEIDEEIKKVEDDRFWRTYDEYSFGHPDKREYARSLIELHKERGTQPPEWAREAVKYRGEAKPKGLEEADKGKGANKAATAAQKLYDMTLRWREEISKLVGTGLEQLDKWYTKEFNEIVEQEQKGAAGTEEALKARAALKELYNAKFIDLERDYKDWVASATMDEIAEIENQQKELLRRFKGFKNAEVNIAEWAEREKASVTLKRQRESLDLLRDQMQNVAGIVPFLSQQLKWSEKILPVQQKIAELALKREIIEKGINPELARELLALQALEAQMQKLNLEKEKWALQGAGGGLKIWAFEQIEESQTRPAQSIVEMMESVEGTISEGLSGAIIGALRGKEADISEVFFRAAEEGLERAIDSLVSTAFDKLAKWILPMEEEAPVLTASTKASFELTAAGTALAEQMVTGATTASTILSSTSIPGLGGGGIPTGFGKGEGIGVGGGIGGGIGGGVGGGFLESILGGGVPFGEGTKNIYAQTIIAGSIQSGLIGGGGGLGFGGGGLGFGVGGQSGILAEAANSPAVGADVSGIESVINQSEGWFSSLKSGLGSLFNKLIGGFKGLEGQSGGFLSQLLGALGGLFKGLIQGIGSGLGGIGGGIGSMFGFQYGGYVTKPTLALIGEAGPEYVVPEKKMKEILPDEQSKRLEGITEKFTYKQFTKELPKFQKGGEFTVKGTGGIDSQLISFMATPGERVSIIPPNKVEEFSEFIKIESFSDLMNLINEDKRNFETLINNESLMNLINDKRSFKSLENDPKNFMNLYNQFQISNESSQFFGPEGQMKNFIEAQSFATGGFVDSPTLAIVGEKGPELIIPQGEMGDIIQSLEGKQEKESEKEIIINSPIYISAPEPSRYYATKEQVQSRRASELRRALRSI